VRQELLSDSPIFDIVRRDAIEPMLERTELPNSQSKFCSTSSPRASS
jgi:hypothetical protein